MGDGAHAFSRRWAWAEIDLDAIGTNVATLRNRIPNGCRFMAVVKANGYGHGAVRVAKRAVSAGADSLGVATVDEAIALREAGILEPILVLSEPPESTIDLLLQYKITPTVFTPEFALALGGRSNANGQKTPFHLKIDTGMNRIGVDPLDAAGFLSSFSYHPGLQLEGVFTHFATADVPGDWEFDGQLQKFNQAIKAIRDEGIDPGIVHAANSAATILHPRAHFDMVRVGIALYGLHPSRSTYDEIDLAPAMSVKAKITHAKKVSVGEGVSYGFSFRSSVDSQLSVVPIGYADGLHRNLSNDLQVLHDGRRVRQVGTICMDQMMLELAGAERRPARGKEFEIGDEVVIIGDQGIETVTMDEVAEKAGTINYELACDFGLRLEKVYIEN